jgi:branched-chain amino acid transport system ATP-binding protein
MLRVENIETYYDTSQALFGMSFEIDAGEVITLLGRNGMGKTTTVNSLMGILKPRAGSIKLDGVEVMGSKSFKMAQLGLGLVPEGRQIFPNLSVRENLIATASNQLEMGDPWTLGRIYELFPELAERKTSMGNLLSGGEQQMLAVGRALMTNPKLLILDEATEGLAPLIRDKIWNALAQIRDSGLSILVIDKNLNDLFKLADRHYIVEKGQVVWSGTSTELQKSSDVQERYLGI